MPLLLILLWAMVVVLGLGSPFLFYVGYRRTSYLPHAAWIWIVSTIGIELFLIGLTLLAVRAGAHLPFSWLERVVIAADVCEIVGMLTFMGCMFERAKEERAYRDARRRDQ